MSSHIFHRVIPLKHRIKKKKRMQRNKTSLQRIPREEASVNLGDMEISPKSFDRTYFPFMTNSKLLVQDGGVGCKALFSRTESRKLNIDKDIKYSIFDRSC